MKRRFKLPGRVILFAALFTFLNLRAGAAEEHFITVTCDAEFPEGMSYLQSLIKKKGYVISRVQKVDKGLRSRGFKTGLYRVVFFGKKQEIETISTHYPQLIPYIPLSITIFEEPGKIEISAIDPVALNSLYKSSEITRMIQSWHRDVQEIFSNYRRCNF